MRIDPGPWEVDENGKRFRRVGPGCIEYPMTITTTYGEFEVDKVPPPPEDKEPPRPRAGETALLIPSVPSIALDTPIKDAVL